MWKFKFYGFFKNLQFFEPYLLLIFINWGYSFFQIGIFVMIREIFTYLFEIPSGIMADKYGKKNELLLCFLFYILSFFLYFLGPGWFAVIFASILYGLGEAFRSGTHKAMELQWMEKKGLLKYKAYIYGKTRSWSLYGSTLNSVLAIVIVFFIPAEKWIFLLATIPFILDFLLISSYPSYMNIKLEKSKLKWHQQLKQDFLDLFTVFKNRRLRKGVFTSATFDSIFKSLKDYIQPIIKIFIVAILINYSLDETQEDFYIKLILGIIYAIFYLVSSFSSKNAYNVIQRIKNTKRTIDLLFDLFAILLLLEAIFMWLKVPILIILFYMVIYGVYNLRRPMLVGYIGELAPKNQRATVLSVESQIKSFLTFLLAPILGIIVDYTSIQVLFIILAAVIIGVNFLFLRGECSTQEINCDSADSIN
ncbi:MFS transporter [Candidatus Lokiarchaeum ossiferum]|uniref:MFS transporter n=1 Tax=Candidatus Lokiarchaeum ossiferum TaxID=2951803 RepID=UPI00352EF687